MPSHLFLLVAGLIGVALVFDYINGFHDAANSIATVVSTRVLSPGQAVIWAAFFNFVAAFGFGTAVAKTIGNGMIDIHAVTFGVIFGGLVGAIVWDLITWYFGLPTSSSHALIGGYAGAAVARDGFGAIMPSGWTKTLIFIVIAPLIGLVLGFLITVAIIWIFQRKSPKRVDRIVPPAAARLRRRLLASATARTTRRRRWASSPACSSPPAIIKTFYDSDLGDSRRAHGDRPRHALAAAGASSTRWARRSRSCSRSAASPPRPPARSRSSWPAHFGIPVSTTHTITGAIVGVGATRRLSAVRWGVAGQIVWAWILTIPMAALIGAVTYWVARCSAPRQ